MAIDIEWLPKPPGTNTENSAPQLFPRMVNCEVVDENKLANLMAENDIYSLGQIKGVITTFAETVAKLFVDGKVIDLPYLGTFKLSVGATCAVTPATVSSTGNVEIRGVRFQPSKELKMLISSPNFHVVARNASPYVPSASELVEPLNEYFKSHDSITRSEFSESSC